MAEIRNSEGYIDLTVYAAIRTIEIEERIMCEMSILKGDIYYVERYQTSGSEQHGARPAIIVSNNKNNNVSGVIEVVYLTTQPKTDLPTHVTIRSTGRNSIALCEQITSISIDRLGNYIATVSDEEMMNIEIALMVSLGISAPKAKTITKEIVKEVPVGGGGTGESKSQFGCRCHGKGAGRASGKGTSGRSGAQECSILRYGRKVPSSQRDVSGGSLACTGGCHQCMIF